MSRAKVTSHTLQFQNPVFNPGTMITVRRGTKWSRLVCPGVHIDIEDASKSFDGYATGTPAQDGIVGEALITGVLLTTFNEIPGDLLKWEHDPKCTTREGLFEEMQRVYGEGFKATDIVTVVLFQEVK